MIRMGLAILCNLAACDANARLKGTKVGKVRDPKSLKRGRWRENEDF